MSERRHGHGPMLPLVMVLLMSQVMLLSSRTYSNGVSIDHELMLERFGGCTPQWVPTKGSLLKEETYRCPGDDENKSRGLVYHFGDHWNAYAWGISWREFATREQAKEYIESQMAYWLRPKAPWWQFWKEFATERPAKPEGEQWKNTW